MSALTLPTELKYQLSKNRLARRVYRRLSLTAKQSYNSYVITASSVDERKKRAEHAVRMMLGYSQSFA
jgi:uncharacterized protein YdeI (YjbR/CyaY-like superfamily)